MLDKNFNSHDTETRLYKMWEDAGAFKPRMDTSREPYCIVIPPPNVTGSLHMGHALNNTLQDILCRFERMRGKDVLWQPGMDHAGIATQMVVERKLAAEGNRGRKDMSREEFEARVWEWKAQSGGNIIGQLKRLGASCDWSRERFTLDEGLSEAVKKVFVELYEEGLIYRDKRLVNWDPHFQTAISDLEVDNREVDGHFWHFKYPLEGGESYEYVEKDEDGTVTLRETRDYISIATTRPETMLGDGAVAVHPDDERYAPIVGKRVRLPLANRLIPIITDEYPDPDFGSGAVKITGAHDFNDYEVAKRNDIPLYPLMDEQARMIASDIMPDKYVGMDRFEARKAVVADIDAEGLLIMTEDKKVMQPFGDRSNVVIEPMLTDQWFVDAKTLAKDAIAAVDTGKTRFVPANWKKTYDNWMHDIQPWCISRQLWWGHRIPAWYGPDGHIFVAENDEEACQNAFKFYSERLEEHKYKDKIKEALGGGYKLSDFYVTDDRADIGGVFNLNWKNPDDPASSYMGKPLPMYRDPDVLDTWFSSALWPFSTLGWPEETEELKRFYPTSVLITAFDIIFFWVARMIMQGLKFMGEIPFHDVYIHALVLDEHGQKMSKSKGNVVNPLELIDTYGADALRFSLAAQAAQGRNVRLSASRVEGYRNFGTKLWNAARFTQMNDCASDPDFDPADCSESINQWIVAKMGEAAAEVTRTLEAYRFNDAADTAYKFAWGTFCDWYLELVKPVLSGPDGPAKSETRACAAWALEMILKLLHPFMPFITEDIWAKTADRPGFLMLADWPQIEIERQGGSDDVDWLIKVISELRSVRAEMNIPPGRKSPALLIGASKETQARMQTYAEALERMARIENWSVEKTAPKGAIQAVVDEVVFALPLAGLIDLDAERDRLSKEIMKARQEIEKIDKKLTNKNFTERAPEAVVNEQHRRRSAFESELEKLSSALANLVPDA